MTKLEAAEKVAKMMKLARGNTNPHEAASARRRAKKIIDDHGLTVEELSTGKKAAALDDLIVALRSVTSNMPAGLFNTSSIVEGILSKAESMSKESKSRRLDEICKLIDVASAVNGALNVVSLSSPLVKRVKEIFEKTLAAHDLTRPH